MKKKMSLISLGRDEVNKYQLKTIKAGKGKAAFKQIEPALLAQEACEAHCSCQCSHMFIVTGGKSMGKFGQSMESMFEV